MNMSYISMQTDGYVQKNQDSPLEVICILETDSLEMFDTITVNQFSREIKIDSNSTT